jgi:urease accessory protein
MLAASPACQAHGFAGSGLLHPLTGYDHMLAMIAVGAWSAQLGGRALWTVPAAFALAMALGAVAGWLQFPAGPVEAAIAASVLAMGVVLAWQRPLALPLAAAAALLFGLAHGYAHGAEMPARDGLGYAAGFLLTTAGLHVAGAVGAMLLLEHRSGQRRLRQAGALLAVIGGVLLHGAVSP